MGSKVIMLLGVLISAFYIYFFINQSNSNINQESISGENQNIVSKVTDTENENIEKESVKEPQERETTKEEEKKEEVEVINKNKRISTPAFGFMTSGDKNQIVALMSDNDEGGVLANYIENLCKKMECSKDLRYENDIIDASWQEEISKIITLMTDGSIDNGSLFIEGNVLKLEGTIKSRDAESRLNTILDGIRSDKLKIENHSTLSPDIAKTDEQPKENKISRAVVTTNKSNNSIKTVEETKEKEDQSKLVAQSIDEAMDEQRIEILSSEDEETKKETLVKDSQKPKKIVKTKPKPKYKPKHVKKSRVVRRATQPDIVAKPVMTTTLDLEKQVTDEEIYEDGPTKGIVAKPYMEIATPKDIEAQKEIDDLLTTSPIHFESKSSNLTQQSKNTLDKVVQIVNEADNKNIVIECYPLTSSGDKVFSKVLSQKRADIVKKYLKNRNIESKVIKSIGHQEGDKDIKSSSDVVDGIVEIRLMSGENR